MPRGDLTYLQYHLHGEYPCESVVEVCEDVVPLAVFLDGVLRGQRDAAHDDDHHDERVEEGERDDSVDENANAAKTVTLATEKLEINLALPIRRGQNEHG